MTSQTTKKTKKKKRRKKWPNGPSDSKFKIRPKNKMGKYEAVFYIKSVTVAVFKGLNELNSC